jgi:DamX protein
VTAVQRAEGQQTQSEQAKAPAPVEEEPAEGAGSQATPQAGGDRQPEAAAERSFALQLIGSYDRNAVLDLAARPDLPESVYIRQETLRGRPWYVLIHSLHPSYAEAQATLRSLPADLARLDTWIRSLPTDTAMEPIRTGQRP